MANTEKIVRRLQHHLKALRNQYPGIWKEIDRARTRLRKAFSWPQWCFMPMAGYLAVLTRGAPSIEGLPFEERIEITTACQHLAALAPWRTTQGIYLFHPILEEEVISTPLTGDLPIAVFYHLPEWCVYVPYEREVIGSASNGFFAHLEWDVNHKRPELRLLIDTEEMFLPVALHLKAGSIDAAIKAAMDEARENADRFRINTSVLDGGPEVAILTSENMRAIVSLVLYLCSVNAEIRSKDDPTKKPGLPKSKIVRRGEVRLFPARKTTVWDVGYRIGETLARHRSGKSTHGGKARPHASPRPHIRRAHWHSFWTGPRKDPEKRKLVLKWLNPILVGGKQDAIVPTIRSVTR